MRTLKQVAKSVLPSHAWGALKRGRVRFEKMRFRPYETTHRYYGYPFKVLIGDRLGQGWYDHDWDLMAEFDLLQSHKLRAGARVFDLGAHQCVVALMLSRIVGPAGSVVALEASNADAEIGRRNRALNAAENLEILNAAVDARSGQITFTLDGHVDDGHRKSAKVEVKSWSIDDLAARYGQPDVLFIDIEGYECHALQGATETLKRRPDCFVEVHGGVGLEEFGGSLQKVLAFFPKDQFELFAGSPDGRPFQPLHNESEFVGRHFYLIAAAR